MTDEFNVISIFLNMVKLNENVEPIGKFDPNRQTDKITRVTIFIL